MNEQRIWQRLSESIDNEYGVAGLMGNLYAESALNPENLQQSYEKKLGYTDATYTKAVDDGTYKNFINDAAGYGLAQWTYWSRKEKLLKHAQEMDVSIGNLEMQLDYLIEELGDYNLIYKLNTSNSVREASDVILTQYEKPANQSENVKEKRAGYGQKYYDTYGKEAKQVNFDKYLWSNGIHYIANSGSDENKQYRGGKAGDQTGHEWELKAWYSRPWSVVLRYPDINVGLKIAEIAIRAALNDKIGYDQGQRTTYWDQLQKVGFNPSNITVACEEDCTAGVTANVKAVGHLMNIPALANLPMDTYSGNMRSRFVKAGFEALTQSKYLTSPDYLLPGDILLYVDHHAATNITYGRKVRNNTNIGLQYGDYGSAVKEMQEALLKWNPNCLPKYGADGEFGAETRAALTEFQGEAGLPITGVYDNETRKRLTSWGTVETQKTVVITGNSVYVRSAPSTDGKILGVGHKGDAFSYQGQDSEKGWHLIDYENENGWVSGKYSMIEG